MDPSIKDYIDTRFLPLLNQILKDLLIQKPDDVQEFLIKWLRNYLNIQNQLTEKEELHHLRMELARLKTGQYQHSQTESSESDDDDYIEIQAVQKKTQQRGGISAEVYGTWNKKEDFQPRLIPKTDDQRQRIINKLTQSFMFNGLEPEEQDIVINAMEERRVQAGQTVIQQGDDGNELFVVDSGLLKCYKRFPNQDEETYLKDYHPGESFGELALLYNAPRAASIIAHMESVLWVLDRDCFNNIVKDAAVRKRQKWEEFLQSVEILQSMDPYERLQLSDVLKTIRFSDGDEILREGEQGDEFYIIEQGTAVAKKVLQQGNPPVVVKEYSDGDYFGELALVNNAPRAATVVATSDMKCVSLDRSSFRRLLGPLENILKRNAAKYEKILEDLKNA